MTWALIGIARHYSILGERKVDKTINITCNNAGEMMISENELEILEEWAKFVEEKFKAIQEGIWLATVDSVWLTQAVLIKITGVTS